MKKKFIVLFMAFFLSGSNLFAESQHFMLQLVNELNYGQMKIDNFTFFDFSLYPTQGLEFNYQIPTKTSLKSYLGLQIFPFTLPGIFLLLNDRIGYAFQKPEKWNSHHIELLGNFGVGAHIMFDEGIAPLCELGCQIFWMPEDKGAFWGFGPEAIGTIVPDYANIIFSLSFNLGYKF